MKIAYCISAYKDAGQLDRLITALETSETIFFIHVDGKVKDITPFRNVVNGHVGARLTRRRFFVQWGGWSQVRYQELFLRESVEAGADRIVILTGQDYPLWGNLRLRDCFRHDSNRVLMTGMNLTQALPPIPPMRKLLEVRHFCRDLRVRNVMIYRILTAGLRRLMTIMPIRWQPYLKIDGERWDVWQSSGYFSVNNKQARYILERLEDKRIRDYFRFCFVPEELTIPTIVFNSPFAQCAERYGNKPYGGLSLLAYMHKFDYCATIKVYQEDDYDSLIQSDKMFCRKVISGASDELVRLIDEHRRQTDDRQV